MDAQDAEPSTSGANAAQEDQEQVIALYQAAEHLVSCPTEIGAMTLPAEIWYKLICDLEPENLWRLSMTCKGLYNPQQPVAVWTEIRSGAKIVQQGHDMLKKAVAAYCAYLTVKSQTGGLTSRLAVQKKIKLLQPEEDPTIPLSSLFGQFTNREREKAHKQAWQDATRLQKAIWTYAQTHYRQLQTTQIELMFAERLQRLVNNASEVKITDK